MQANPVILFDGVCNFCNSAINFVMRQDKKAVFKFASLQSATAEQLLQQHDVLKTFDSFILVENGQVFQKSIAALKVLKRLPWYWQWTQIFWIVPKFFRNGVYDVIAKNRYRWFGKKDQCMVPTADQKKRFLN